MKVYFGNKVYNILSEVISSRKITQDRDEWCMLCSLPEHTNGHFSPGRELKLFYVRVYSRIIRRRLIKLKTN